LGVQACKKRKPNSEAAFESFYSFFSVKKEGVKFSSQASTLPKEFWSKWRAIHKNHYKFPSSGKQN